MLIFGVSLVLLFCSSCNKNNENPVSELLTGWAAGDSNNGYSTIFFTQDGGTNWVRQGNASSLPDADLNDIRAIDKDNVWAIGAQEGGYAVILRTNDGGKTWQRQGSASELPDVEMSGICPVNSNIAYAAGGDGWIIKTTDGGESWSMMKADTSYHYSYQMVAAPDEYNVWAVGEGDTVAVIHYSPDGGQTWVRQGTDSLTTDNMPNALIDIHAMNANYIWAVGPSQAIYTEDGGNTWINKPTPVAFYHNNGVCIVDQEVVWVATDDNLIFKLHSMQGEWEQQRCVGAESAMYMGITATNPDVAWITTNTYSNGGQILYTEDGGDTWVIQAIPEDVALRRISFVNGKR